LSLFLPDNTPMMDFARSRLPLSIRPQASRPFINTDYRIFMAAKTMVHEAGHDLLHQILSQADEIPPALVQNAAAID
jgi:hypothetical protein